MECKSLFDIGSGNKGLTIFVTYIGLVHLYGSYKKREVY